MPKTINIQNALTSVIMQIGAEWDSISDNTREQDTEAIKDNLESIEQLTVIAKLLENVR